MNKFIHILGARPQFVKAGIIVNKMINKGWDCKIIHTGQHFDSNMSDIFFSEMNLPTPDYNLGIHSMSHGEMTGEMIIQIERLLVKEKPDFIVIYGDTNSTLAGAIAAKKLDIKIIHIEGGIRNYDFKMPEEINRILVDKISNIVLCPTEHSMDNMIMEACDRHEQKCYFTGDIMYDCYLQSKNIFKYDNVPNNDYALVTIHRQENVDDHIEQIVDFLNSVNEKIQILFPIHPRTRNKINKEKLTNRVKFKTIDPVGYLNMQGLIEKSSFVITDSGGLIKEAYYHKKPSLCLLKNPVWPELEKASINSWIGDSELLNKCDSIIYGLEYMNKHIDAQHQKSHIFGNGTTCDLIIKSIEENI